MGLSSAVLQQTVATCILLGGYDMSTKNPQIDKLQNELVSSAAPLRDLVKGAKAAGKTYAANDPIGGSLHGPVTFPPNPTANQPFSMADALQVHIPRDSTPGTYDILFGIDLLSPGGDVVSKAVLVWPVAPEFGPEFGWAPTAQDVPGQSAGRYTIVSLLTLQPPEGQPIQLDAKSMTLTIAS
jgi:hypothetical protein